MLVGTVVRENGERPGWLCPQRLLAPLEGQRASSQHTHKPSGSPVAGVQMVGGGAVATWVGMLTLTLTDNGTLPKFPCPQRLSFLIWNPGCSPPGLGGGEFTPARDSQPSAALICWWKPHRRLAVWVRKDLAGTACAKALGQKIGPGGEQGMDREGEGGM